MKTEVPQLDIYLIVIISGSLVRILYGTYSHPDFTQQASGVARGWPSVALARGVARNLGKGGL